MDQNTPSVPLDLDCFRGRDFLLADKACDLSGFKTSVLLFSVVLFSHDFSCFYPFCPATVNYPSGELRSTFFVLLFDVRFRYDGSPVNTENEKTPQKEEQNDSSEISSASEEIKKTDDEKSPEPEEQEAETSQEIPETDDKTSDKAQKTADEPQPESTWDQKIQQAHKLWEEGDNASLNKLLEELRKAPSEEKQVHEVVKEYTKRLRPDPVAIALWVLTFGVFCFLTYYFVLR